MQVHNDELSTLCQEAEETTLHLLRKCCALINQRLEILSSHFLDYDDLALLHWKSLLRLAKDFEYLGCAFDQSCKAPALRCKCSRQWKKKKRKKVYLRSGLIIELGWWGESALYGRHALVLTGCIKVWWAIIWLRCCVQNISVIVNNGWAFHVTTSTNLQLQYRHLQQTAITWSRK